MPEKRPRYIDGLGWRYDVDTTRHHRQSDRDYYDRGIYHVTIATDGRRPLFGRVCGSTAASQGSPLAPHLEPSELGLFVQSTIENLPAHFAVKGLRLSVTASQVMPDHVHLVLFIIERSDISLGEVVRSFKAACTSHYRKMLAQSAPSALSSASPSSVPSLASPSEALSSSSALLPKLWEPIPAGYHERPLCYRGQLQAMIEYVRANPFRLLVRRERPQFMERRQHLLIAGSDYAAFGNIFLLRHPMRQQVFCHRRARLSQLTAEERRQYGYPLLPAEGDEYRTTNVDYTHTAAFAHQRDEVMEQARSGVVIVTPGISPGEKAIMHLCLENGFRLIILQNEPIGQFWKPERSRFEACARGSLLILSPWNLEGESRYEHFHNLNTFAASICDEGLQCVLKKE